jgi:riboflavin kinase/FMN adenylyltransferase
MVIYDYPLKEKQNTKGCVLALGFFDGVHIAHRNLISRAKDIAVKNNLQLGIFTFKSDGNIKSGSERLYDDKEKSEIFESLGADFVFFADFDAISGVSAEDFVKKMLVDDIGCKICVAGFNFRFGKGASGKATDLCKLMQECNGEAIICEEIKANEETTLSASLIRDLIKNGEIKSATEMLGAPYYIKGRVLPGRQVGRVLGFPTVNIPIAEGKIIPRPGVYRTAIPIDGKIYSGVTNIGVCPTFELRSVHLEGYIINFNGNLYNKELKVFLLDFLRDEKAFSSLDELKDQINIDTNRVISENGDITWQDLGLK